MIAAVRAWARGREAGLDVDVEMLSLTGSLMPLAIAASLGLVALDLEWRAALAVGYTLAPTSMGIALNVLKKGKVLNIRRLGS